jgi:hypothetical protein
LFFFHCGVSILPKKKATGRSFCQSPTTIRGIEMGRGYCSQRGKGIETEHATVAPTELFSPGQSGNTNSKECPLASALMEREGTRKTNPNHTCVPIQPSKLLFLIAPPGYMVPLGIFLEQNLKDLTPAVSL